MSDSSTADDGLWAAWDKSQGNASAVPGTVPNASPSANNDGLWAAWDTEQAHAAAQAAQPGFLHRIGSDIGSAWDAMVGNGPSRSTLGAVMAGVSPALGGAAAAASHALPAPSAVPSALPAAPAAPGDRLVAAKQAFDAASRQATPRQMATAGFGLQLASKVASQFGVTPGDILSMPTPAGWTPAANSPAEAAAAFMSGAAKSVVNPIASDVVMPLAGAAGALPDHGAQDALFDLYGDMTGANRTPDAADRAMAQHPVMGELGNLLGSVAGFEGLPEADAEKLTGAIGDRLGDGAVSKYLQHAVGNLPRAAVAGGMPGAVQSATKTLQAGGSVPQSLAAAMAGGLGGTAQFVVPTSLGGNVLARALGGEAIQQGLSRGTQAVQHAIAPQAFAAPHAPDLTNPMTYMGALLGAVGGHAGDAENAPAPTPPSPEDVIRQRFGDAAAEELNARAAPPLHALPAPVITVDPEGNAQTSASYMTQLMRAEQAQAAARQTAQARAEMGLTPDIEHSQAPRWQARQAAEELNANRLAFDDSRNEVMGQRTDDAPLWWMTTHGAEPHPMQQALQALDIAPENAADASALFQLIDRAHDAGIDHETIYATLSPGTPGAIRQLDALTIEAENAHAQALENPSDRPLRAGTALPGAAGDVPGPQRVPGAAPEAENPGGDAQRRATADGDQQGHLPDEVAHAQALGTMLRKDPDSELPLLPTIPVDTTGSVPLGGGVSQDGSTVYLDKRLPRFLDVPNSRGEPVRVDVHDVVAHANEAPEFPQMDRRSKPYGDAHDESANTYEATYLRSKYDVSHDAFNKALEPFLQQAHDEGAGAADIPPDLDRTPARAAAVGIEAEHVPDDALTPDERASITRQRQVQRDADDAQAHAAVMADYRRKVSAEQGEQDADALGLRGAVSDALAGRGEGRVHFVRDEAGLPAHVATRARPRQEGNVRYGLHTPDGHTYLFTQHVRTPERAAWTAIHEVGGHEGFHALVEAHPDVKMGSRSVLGAYATAREMLLQNPTVRALARAIGKQRGSFDTPRMAEEAAAELQAALRTGRWDEIERKYGVRVAPGIRDVVQSAITHFARRIKAILNAIHTRMTGKATDPFTDADVHDMLDAMWELARGNPSGRGNDEAPTASEERAPFADQVHQRLASGERHGAMLDMGRTPAILRMLGFHDLPLQMPPEVLFKLATGKGGERAPLTERQIARLPELMDEPQAVLRSTTKADSVVIVTDAKDAEGKPVVVAVAHDRGREGNPVLRVNVLTSAYGKGDLNWFKREGAAGRALYTDQEKTLGRLVGSGSALHSATKQGTQGSSESLRSPVDLRNFRAAERARRLSGGMQPTDGDVMESIEPRERAGDDRHTGGPATGDTRSPTGVKNEHVAAERRARGLDALDAEGRRTFGDVWEAARQKLADDPTAGARLAEHIGAHPRALNAEETAILTKDRAAIANRRTAAAKELIAARNAGDTVAEAAAQMKLREADEAMETSDKAARASGYEQGLGLAMRKALSDTDYSLANMQARLEARTGKPLTPEQHAKVADIDEHLRKNAEAQEALQAKRRAAKNAKPTSPLDDAHQQMKDAYVAYRRAKLSRDEIRQRQLAKQIADLNDRIKRGDFAKRPRPTIDYNAETNRLIGQRNNLRRRFDTLAAQAEYHASSRATKAISTALTFRRAIMLSSVETLAKLSAAASYRVLLGPLEHGVQGALGKLPGLRGIADKAPLEGHFSAKAEGRALAETFSRDTLRDMRDKFKRGESERDLLYGKLHAALHPFLDLVGNMHAALKTPAERNEFARAREMATEHEVRQAIARGMTPEQVADSMADPRTQGLIGAKAFEASQRAVLKNKNFATSAYAMLMHSLENAGKPGSAERAAAKTTARALDYVFPIVKVPTNFALESASYAVGAAKAAVQLIAAQGVKNLTPEQADYIMRNLGKQTIGAALMTIGWFESKHIGSFYQTGDNKRKGIPAEGSVGWMPKWAIDTPAGMALTIGATLHRVYDGIPCADGWGRVKGTGGAGNAALAATRGWWDSIPFFDEPARLAEDFHDTDSLTQGAGKELAGAVTPPDLRHIAQATDSHPKRYPRGFLDEMKMGVPGLREQVPSYPERHW